MQNQRTRRILYTQPLTMVSFQIILEELHVILFKLREIKDLPQRSPMPGSDRIWNLNSRVQPPVLSLWSADTEEFRADLVRLSKPGLSSAPEDHTAPHCCPNTCSIIEGDTLARSSCSLWDILNSSSQHAAAHLSKVTQMCMDVPLRLWF